ncbi:hypothetical protein [Enterococcus italicus]|uniref:hypothetical protein n=1 Tax=Enterococcus italicus TaxID=246144 RepID=UPI0028B00A7F|nr:hypothetical protein [Enterococcus italicus]
MDWSTFTTSDWIAFLSIIVTLLTSLVAILISTASLVQNRNIIKESNAPKVYVYIEQHPHNPAVQNLIIENGGYTETKVLDICFDEQLDSLDKEFLNKIVGTNIYPKQKLVSVFITYSQNKKIFNSSITVTYTVYKEKRKESFYLDLDRARRMYYLDKQSVASEIRDISKILKKTESILEKYFKNKET